MHKFLLLSLLIVSAIANDVSHQYMAGVELGIDQTSYVDCTSRVTKVGIKGFQNKDKLSYNKTGPLFGIHGEYGATFNNLYYLGLNAGVSKRFYHIRGNYFYKFNQNVRYTPKETYHFCGHIGRYFDSIMGYLKGGVSLLKRKSTVSYNVPQKIERVNNGTVRGCVMGIGMRFPLTDNMCGAVELKHTRYQKENTKFNEGLIVTQRFKSNALSFLANYVF